MQSKQSGIPYIERLDHLRFFAAVVVLLFHSRVYQQLASPTRDWFTVPLINEGHTCVPLFMVISGMILSIIAQGKEIIVAKFYLNRLLRIYPLFVFIVTLGYFSAGFLRPTSTGVDYLLSLLPISNLYLEGYGKFGGQAWSIAVELQFYLLFPFLLLFRRRYGARYFLSLAGFLILLRGLVFLQTGTVFSLSFFSLFGNLEIFLIGILAGDAYTACGGRRQWWNHRSVVVIYFLAINLLIFGLFKIPGFFQVVNPGLSSDGLSHSPIWIIWPTIQAMMWAGFVLVYLKSELPIPGSRLLAVLGTYSYSIYMWHFFVLEIARHHYHQLSPYMFGLLVVLPPTLVIAALSYHLIEKPFLSLRVRYTQKPADSAAPPAQA